MLRNNGSHLQGGDVDRSVEGNRREAEGFEKQADELVAFARNGEVSSTLTVPRLGPRRVRSYLREDLLFGKSFSRCQPAAGRTELTARTPQFLFPLPLPSSTSGLRLFLVYLPSLVPLLLANTLHSSSIRRVCGLPFSTAPS